MPELIVSPEADEDLIELWLHIASDRDAETADKFLDSLHRKFEMLLQTPHMGRDRGELAPYLRSISERNYVIFYRPIMNSVEIVRVLHGRRDIESLFSGEE